MTEDLRYSMVIAWSDDDGAYIVTVPELPGCVAHGATCEVAVATAREVVAGFVEALRTWGDPVLAPRTTLEGLLAGVKEAKQHGEIATGSAVGREAW